MYLFFFFNRRKYKSLLCQMNAWLNGSCASAHGRIAEGHRDAGLCKSWLQADWHLPCGTKSPQSGPSSCLITGDFTADVPARTAFGLARGRRKTASATDPKTPFNITGGQKWLWAWSWESQKKKICVTKPCILMKTMSWLDVIYMALKVLKSLGKSCWLFCDMACAERSFFRA